MTSTVSAIISLLHSYYNSPFDSMIILSKVTEMMRAECIEWQEKLIGVTKVDNE
jgi:hypothetical protein